MHNTCFLCKKKRNLICQKCHIQSQKAKIQQIKSLKLQVEVKRQKLSNLIQQNYIQSAERKQKKKAMGIMYNDKKQNLQKKLKQISKKQMKLIQIRKLKSLMQQKTSKLQQYKQQRKQKFKRIAGYQSHLKQLKQLSSQIQKNQLNQIQNKIKQKALTLNQTNKEIKAYLKQIIINILCVLKNLHQSYIRVEMKQCFQIRQVQQLDIFQYNNSNESNNKNREQNLLLKSFYQLENVQQVNVKRKMSEKGLHVVFQNALLLKILQQIFDIWLPYPIQCQINLNQSKLVTKFDEIKIGGKCIIDFTNSTQISKNIVQFFPSRIKSPSKQNLAITENKSSSLRQTFQNLHINQKSRFHKPRIQLNKLFVNYLQVNLQFMNLKHGIDQRPLVFLSQALMKKIIREFLASKLYVDYGEQKRLSSWIQKPNYKSMLKQIKMYRLLQVLQRQQNQQTQQQQNDNYNYYNQKPTLDGVKQQTQQENEQSSSRSNPSSKYLQVPSEQVVERGKQLQMSVYELLVPQNISTIKSSSTENDDFELLAE